MPPRKKKATVPAPQPAASEVVADARARLGNYRKGLPVGEYQRKAMADAAAIGQVLTKVACLRLASILRKPGLTVGEYLAAAKVVLDRFMPGVPDSVNVFGMVGTPADYQAAIDAAFARFMVERERYRVEATDATVVPEFTVGNGNGHISEETS